MAHERELCKNRMLGPETVKALRACFVCSVGCLSVPGQSSTPQGTPPPPERSDVVGLKPLQSQNNFGTGKGRFSKGEKVRSLNLSKVGAKPAKATIRLHSMFACVLAKGSRSSTSRFRTVTTARGFVK